MAGPLIVTAEIAPLDFSWLQGLRRAYYPPARNQVPAHLTMFRALPPSIEAELRSRLARIVCQRAPAARIAGVLDLGGGVAFRVVSADLDRMREELAADLHGLLSSQDSVGWRPHVTIQNKVAPKVARALKAALESNFEPRLLGITGFAIHRYLGGPWAPVADYSFRP